ncbi:uncharacterized protein C8R40DRAFT_1128128 [Lentinula edodes]|uniref:uncharacterized protein n=1 Tax=Lentinula edodes TaxID=5353 RepID=UPI001E8DDA14|nr:uncharacterized protein C8R40DRAFT_1128128 [Lentinula edodes]KAH7870138.1 hypothetical protein C8R40DRAFT_1128128 [Lentinula edodes]
MRSFSVFLLLSTLLVIIPIAFTLPTPPPPDEIDVRLIRIKMYPGGEQGSILYDDTVDEADLVPSLIDPHNEMWALNLDGIGYASKPSKDKWIEGGPKEFSAKAGILLGKLEVDSSKKKEARTKLIEALNKVSPAEIDVLYIYSLLALIETQALALPSFKQKIALREEYLPYMKVMLEKNGSGARVRITQEEEQRYKRTLGHLFPKSGGN